MANYYLVETVRGPAWDHTASRRQQAGWTAHAAFMDGLAEAGVIVLGGPVGELDGDRALLVLDAENEQEVRALLKSDPWTDGVLSIASVRPWTIWLRSAASVGGPA